MTEMISADALAAASPICRPADPMPLWTILAATPADRDPDWRSKHSY